MRKITSLLTLLMAFFGLNTAFAQGDNTVEYEAWPGWTPNDNASVYWVGFLTPGSTDKTFEMSAFQFYQVSGYGNAECYTAICTEVPDYSSIGSNARQPIIPAESVLAVSTNTVNAGAEAYYNYNLEQPIELQGGTVYYMVFLASNEPTTVEVEGVEVERYTCSSTRVRLRNGVSYEGGMCLGNGALRSDLAPGFKATLTMSEYDYALIVLGQVVAQINFDAEAFPADIPGGYPSELIGACEEAFWAASDLSVDPGDATLEEIQTTTQKLRDAYEALLAGRLPVPFNAGTYYLVNARVGTTANFINIDSELTSVDAAYANGDNALWSAEFNATVFGEEANPAYIWQVEEAGTNEEGKQLYTIRNYAYEKYMANTTGTSVAYGLTADVEEAAKFVVNGSDPIAGFVTFTNSAITGTNNSLHAATSGTRVVNWAANAEASAWTVVAVDDETLALMGEKSKQMRDEYNQRVLNDTLTHYFTLATEAREAGRTFLFDGSNDGQFLEGEGLIIDPSQLWSNAKDPGEGTYEGLLDTDYTTFFHTSWHASAPASEAHYLQMDLGEAVDTLVLKYGVRSNAGSNDIPYLVTLYGTNDEAMTLHTESTGTPGEDGFVAGDTVSCAEWVNLGQFTMAYPYTLLDAEGNAVNNSGRRTAAPVVMGAGVTVFELPAAYRYYRLSIDETVQSIVNNAKRTNGDGFNYWNLGSLRAFVGKYDPDCVYAHMDPAARQELEASIVAAAAELTEEAATQATIDRIKAAYAAYMAVYPDKAVLLAAIEEAKTWTAAAVEGEEIGNFAAGAKDAYDADITAAEAVAEGVLTFAAYKGALESLESAYNTFASKLVTPEPGFYTIQSLTTGAANGSYLVARSTSTTSNRANNGLGWNYAGKNAGDYLNTLWYVEKLDNGKFTFKNMATGYYIDNTQTNLSGGIAQVAEPVEIALRAARDTAGVGLNFVLNEEGTLFGNADPSAGFVVWNGAKGNDNSAWYFETADYGQMMTIDLNKPVSVHTLPFAAMAYGDCYSVAGITEDGASVALNAISEIPAGTPFVIVADTSVTKNVQMMLYVTSVDDIAYVREPLTVNGLVGTFEPDTISETELVMKADCSELVYANTAALQNVAANSGYFVWSTLQELPRVSAGDQLLPLMEDLVNGIGTLVAEPAAGKRQGVFTLQGQKITDTRNLPAGVYIVNGRKVLVK